MDYSIDIILIIINYVNYVFTLINFYLTTFHA